MLVGVQNYSRRPVALQMPGAARPASYQNQGFAISTPKPRRNRSNTIPKANKTIPAETPIMPVTLILLATEVMQGDFGRAVEAYRNNGRSSSH